MKWKELMKVMDRKRLLFLLLVATAALATIFVSYAINRTTTQATYKGSNGVHTFPTNTDGHVVLHGFDGTGFGTPPDGFTQFQLADNSQVRQGSGATGSTPTQLADNSGDDSSATYQNTKEGDAGQGSDSTNSETSSDSDGASSPTLLVQNNYTEHDRDIQSSHGVGQGPQSTVPDTSGGSGNEPPSHVPEPASMLLLGSGLIGLAAFARKLRKS